MNPGAENTFDIVVPDPGTPLRARVIHPDNLALQEKASAYLALKLPSRKVKLMEKELKRLNAQLESVGWDDVEARMDTLADQWRALTARRKEILELKETVSGDDLARLVIEFHDVRQQLMLIRSRGEQLQERRSQYHPLARKRNAIKHKLDQHYAAIEREAAYKKAEIKLADEAMDWHDIVRECLTGLGFCYRFSKNGKEYTRRVKFKYIYAGLDNIWLQVLGSEKSWFGWKWHLPRGVNPIDFLREDVVKALQVATERDVQVIHEKKSGITICINRLGVADGIVERVTYQQIMSTYGQANHAAIPIPIGVKSGLEVWWAELMRFPHVLIAGSSGSGKSNLVNGITITVLGMQKPEDVRLIMVDMKEGTEFGIFADNRVPHLIGDCITTPPAFLDVLTQLEMLRIERSEQLRAVYAKDIDEYNARMPAGKKMPRIVVIIDEFSAIYMSSPFQSETENRRIADQIKALVRQLLAKARAAGITLIICTQSPYVEILPGIDKANIALKICGRFLDKTVSRAILGNGAAADIPEQTPGRMIVQTAGRMFLVQTPLVTRDDIEAAIQASKLNEAASISMPALPEGKTSKPLTREELIQIVLDKFGGKMPFKRIWDDEFKGSKRVSSSRLEEMIKELAAERVIEHEGVTYKVVKTSGNIWAFKAELPVLDSQISEELTAN